MVTPRQQEWVLGGLGAGLVGYSLYELHKRGVHIPGCPPNKQPTHPSPTSTAGPSSPGKTTQRKGPPRIAPTNLPAHVTRRCGTAYVSFGTATHKPGYIIVGKYVNGRLAVEYYQQSRVNPRFDPVGSWVGGRTCANATPPKTTKVLTVSQCNTLIRQKHFTYSIRNVGSSLPCVQVIQRLLNRRGYHLVVDGDFGPNTQQVVEDYQRRVGLVPNGVVAQNAQNITWQLLVKPPSNYTPPGPTYTHQVPG